MKKYLNSIVLLISVATVFSGLLQVIAPSFVLGFIGADITPASSHFFAIIGMFMTLFGGLVLNAVYSATPNTVAITWAALQKLGASVAVGIGIANGIFSMLAAGVAVFDLFSGIIFFWYLTFIKKE